MNIIPKPNCVEESDSKFVLDSKTTIKFDTVAMNAVQLLQETVKQSTGFELKEDDQAESNFIEFVVTCNGKMEDEEYILSIVSDSIVIIAKTYRGFIWGVQSLLQHFGEDIYSAKKIEKEWAVKYLVVNDKPRFPWRGAMLDVARHMTSLDNIKRLIDLLSMHKLNTLHLHLTDDQGWRVEIKKYPALTNIGSYRKKTLITHDERFIKRYENESYGGYYSQESLKDLVAYATKMGVTIVPEVDMPGHMQAAIASYPEFGCTNKKVETRTTWGISKDILTVNEITLNFVKDVLDEIMEIFPGRYIHIGGDEALKNHWKKSKEVQMKMADLGITNEENLQAWFMKQVVEHLNKNGRQALGWDEIMESNMDEGITITSWRNEKGGIEAVNRGLKAIMTPMQYTYFDHYQKDPKKEERLCIGGFTTLEKVYHYEPIPKDIPKGKEDQILGTQGQLWTEYIRSFNEATYMYFPRLIALAEVAWTQRYQMDFDDFKKRLEIMKKIFNVKGIVYCGD